MMQMPAGELRFARFVSLVVRIYRSGEPRGRGVESSCSREFLAGIDRFD